jgi:hypothetical protein
VIEKILDVWLDRLPERALQSTLAHILSKRGWTIVHLSRHCAMEMGKDIIALDPQKNPCAFQLKVQKQKKFKLNDWRKINRQVIDLCYLAIDHPSIGTYKGNHKSYLVINNEFEEEASRAISDFNSTLRKDRKPKLKTIVKGELLNWLQEDHPNVFPSELQDTKLLLELFLEPGNSYLNREKFAELLENFLSVTQRSKLTKEAISNRISGAAILTSVATSEFARLNNHVAKIEAWTIFLSYTFATAEKWKLAKKYWLPQAEITKEIIYNLLIDLFDELISRKHFMEADEISDSPFYKPRMTYCIALMSILGIWDRFYLNNDRDNHEEKIMQFINSHEEKLLLWGESAVPQFLAYYWYSWSVDATTRPDMFLKSIIEAILKSNKPKDDQGIPLAMPYYQIQDVIPQFYGFYNNSVDDTFRGRSFMLEGLIHILVRRNYKQNLKLSWPEISRFSFESFQPDKKWQYHLWRSREGTNKSTYPPFTKQWDELKEESFESNGKSLPKPMKQFIPIYLIFLCVFPHRATPEAIRWLDKKIFEKI